MRGRVSTRDFWALSLPEQMVWSAAYGTEFAFQLRRAGNYPVSFSERELDSAQDLGTTAGWLAVRRMPRQPKAEPATVPQTTGEPLGMKHGRDCYCKWCT